MGSDARSGSEVFHCCLHLAKAVSVAALVVGLGLADDVLGADSGRSGEDFADPAADALMVASGILPWGLEQPFG